MAEVDGSGTNSAAATEPCYFSAQLDAIIFTDSTCNVLIPPRPRMPRPLPVSPVLVPLDVSAPVETVPLPAVAQRFQRQYDDGADPEPFEFEMPGLEAGREPFTHFRSVAVAHSLLGEVAPA